MSDDLLALHGGPPKPPTPCAWCGQVGVAMLRIGPLAPLQPMRMKDGSVRPRPKGAIVCGECFEETFGKNPPPDKPERPYQTQGEARLEADPSSWLEALE